MGAQEGWARREVGVGHTGTTLCPCSSAEGVGLQSGASTFLTSEGMEVQSPPG